MRLGLIAAARYRFRPCVSPTVTTVDGKERTYRVTGTRTVAKNRLPQSLF